jgi:hypothetical protein
MSERGELTLCQIQKEGKLEHKMNGSEQAKGAHLLPGAERQVNVRNNIERARGTHSLSSVRKGQLRTWNESQKARETHSLPRVGDASTHVAEGN